MVQDVKPLALAGNRFKHIEYEYDLISGNVKAVHYQQDEQDGFHHRYHYDEDNRLTVAETSPQEEIWHKDAKYFYYPHGPLARVEIGEEKVHGQDFYYTLQGWLKGINSNTLEPSRDPGKDGTLGYIAGFDKIHKTIAEDTYSYTLGYYDGDYKEVSNLLSSAHPIVSLNGSSLDAALKDLYNGNISHSVTNIPKTGNLFGPQAAAYEYDQLHRLKKMETFTSLNLTSNSWGPGTTTDYLTTYSYDPNGNITFLTRNGLSSIQTAMDDLEYKYQANNNKLDYVIETATDDPLYNDIKQGQVSGNYTYDLAGRIISDTEAGIDDIEWNIHGKIKKMTMSSGDEIFYTYDPFGNRIMKKIVHAAGGETIESHVYDGTRHLGTIIGDNREAIIFGKGRIGTYGFNTSVPIKGQVRGQKKL